MNCIIIGSSADRASLVFGGAILLGVLFGLIPCTGCQQPEVPFDPKPAKAPAPVHCFDGVPHMKGSAPFVQGGTCCCTPSQALLDQYKADGVVSQTVTLDELIKLYKNAGIHTTLDHQRCNNLCKWGPHVVKGGKCMVPPTPGTPNYEEIRFGIRYVPSEKE